MYNFYVAYPVMDKEITLILMQQSHVQMQEIVDLDK